MRRDAFNINKFNLFEDDENYYFFRALNLRDSNDIQSNITTDSNGDIVRIRTDRERFGEGAKYSSDARASLEEFVDHIKIHYLRETNCISLTSNANTALMYGREFYNDQYVMVKVPKDELGKKVFQAGPYMLEEIETAIEEEISSFDSNDRKKYETLFDRIDGCKSEEELNTLKQFFLDNRIVRDSESSLDDDIFVGGLDFKITKSVNYNSLDSDANLEKDKVILKLDLMGKQILPKISNRLLVQTVGGAFSSSELIHYGDIYKDELINVSSEMMDILSILQQVPESVPYIDEIKGKILDYVKSSNVDRDLDEYNYEKASRELTIDNVYSMFDNGKVSYQDASEMHRKIFYLAKSRLRGIKTAEVLENILGDEPKYSVALQHMILGCYGIEPEITTRVSKDLIKVSESVSLDLGREDLDLIKYINMLTPAHLRYIMMRPIELLDVFAGEGFFEKFKKSSVDRTDYIADSLIDALDLKSYGVKLDLSLEQREDIKEKLKEFNLEELYDFCKNNGVLEKDLSRIIFTNLIKGTRDFDTKEEFTLEELEWFIGYNRVKNTDLNLLSYQRPIIGTIKEKYKTKQFTSAVMPTGTGKTYVALAVMNEFEKLKRSIENDSHAEILYLAPNNEILDQLKETIRKAYRPEEHIGEDIDTVIKRVFPNLTLSTYQNLKDNSTIDIDSNGKKELKLKKEFDKQFDFIVLDETHRTGATEWYSAVGTLLDSQGEETKILGISATPERDVDGKDMMDFWARKYNYSEEEILTGEHMSFELSLIDAIKMGIVNAPTIVNCEYSLLRDGTLEDLKMTIDGLLDDDIKTQELIKYETLRRNIENSDGIEKILGDNIKDGNKFIVFLPVTKKDDGTYVDDDGEEVEDSKAKQMIKDYQTLFMQYFYANKYFEEHRDTYNIYLKLVSGVNLDDNDRRYLESEKDNLLLLSKIKLSYKPNALDTKMEDMSARIISEMGWTELEKAELVQKLNEKMSGEIENYSMLGEYSNSENKSQLSKFRRSSSDAKKFMFVVNKLNEGVHVGDVDGIVWLRPMSENSTILYQQQLGRCITANLPNQQAKTPLVLDLVNNTLKVRLDKGELQEERDLKNFKVMEKWISNNNRFPDINSLNEEETEYAQLIRRLQTRYVKYLDEEKLKEEKNTENIVLIREILRRGSDLGLWDVSIPVEENRVKNISGSYSKDDDSIYGYLQLNAVSRNFLELQGESERYETAEFDKTFEKYYNALKLLKDSGKSTRLKRSDRLYIYEGKDGTRHVQVVKIPSTNAVGEPALSKDETEEEWNERKTLYYSDKVKSVGEWLYQYYYNDKRKRKLTETQRQKLDELGCKMRQLDVDFEEYYNDLKLLKNSGKSTRLKSSDRLYVYENNGEMYVQVLRRPDTNDQGEPAFSKGETEEEWNTRYTLYYSDKVKTVGDWLNRYYYNDDGSKNKLTNEQKKALDELGCRMSTFDFIFNQYYGLLEIAHAQGQPTNLSKNSKLYVYEKNGEVKVEVVKKPPKKSATPEQKQKYADAQYNAGLWLTANYAKLNETQQDALVKIGYTKGDEQLKKKSQFAEAKDEFDANSTFTEVVEKINESTKNNVNDRTDTGEKGGQK